MTSWGHWLGGAATVRPRAPSCGAWKRLPPPHALRLPSWCLSMTSWVIFITTYMFTSPLLLYTWNAVTTLCRMLHRSLHDGTSIRNNMTEVGAACNNKHTINSSPLNSSVYSMSDNDSEKRQWEVKRMNRKVFGLRNNLLHITFIRFVYSLVVTEQRWLT